MEDNDFYRTLGVARDADLKTIKSAYRKIARENHPDLNPDDPAAEERFKAASRAFEVLGDPDKRKIYDEFGIEGLREGFDPDQARAYQQWQDQVGGGRGGRGGQTRWSYGPGAGASGYEDIFGSIFGGRSPFDASDFSSSYGGGGFYTGPLKGQDLEAALTLDFMTAVRGGEIELRLGNRNIKVRIPAGAADGEKLRLKGQGQPAPAQAPRGQAGDLLLTLNVQPHPLLERRGLDLYLDLPVTIGEAIGGAKIAVPTPDGEYKVTIPSGVHSGARLRLKGKGVHRGKREGDFYVIIQIQSPDRIDDELREAARAVDAGYTHDVRKDLHL